MSKPKVNESRFDFRGEHKCACGCGKLAGVYVRTGKPKIWIKGHNGIKILTENRDKINKGILNAALKSNPPSLIPEELDIAWAAGIYEGEGSVWARKSVKRNGDPSYSLRVQVAQKDDELLHRLKAYFGGAIIPHSQRSGVGVWHLTSHIRSKNFIETIYPWLTNRRKEQFKKALVRCG